MPLDQQAHKVPPVLRVLRVHKVRPAPQVLLGLKAVRVHQGLLVPLDLKVPRVLMASRGPLVRQESLGP